jgi:uncharacterized protein YkwD
MRKHHAQARALPLAIALVATGVALNTGCGASSNHAAPSQAAAQEVPHEVHGSPGDCYKGDAFACAAEAEVIRLTNVHRSDSGLPPLAASGHLGFVARDWSTTQANDGDISHNGFPDSRTQVYTQEFGTMEGIWVSGENVAMYTGGESQAATDLAAQITEQWWESPGHRDNMLGSFDGIGVGIVRTSDGAVYGTQDFYNKNGKG